MTMTENQIIDNEKMTQAKALQFVLNECELPEDVANKLQSMLNSIEKRNGKESKKVAERKALDLQLRQSVVDFLSQQQEPVNANTIFKEIPEFDQNNFSVQKVVSLVTYMAKDGIIQKEVIQGKVYYSLNN